LTDTGEKSDWT